MKWNNKGCEFDAVGLKIKALKIFIFGAGYYGKQLYEKLKNHVKVEGFIDNSFQKQKDGCLDLPVYSVEDYKEIFLTNSMVIISVSDKNIINSIIKQLENCGLKYNENLFDKEKFEKDILHIYLWYNSKKLYSKKCSIVVTERCNLNCKYCSLLIPRLKNKEHISLYNIKKDADLLFGAFDYIYSFFLFGGEPFLHPDLANIITYIGHNYQAQIGRIFIITNGTVKPSEKVIKTLKKYDVKVEISDYTVSFPNLTQAVNQCTNLLKECEVDYSSNIVKWMDIGYDTVNRYDASEKELTDWFDSCKMDCRFMRDGKYYYCGLSVSANKVGIIDQDAGDYYDLENFDKKDKGFLLEFNEGYNDKGYVNLCRKCNGYYNINKNYITSAEQINIGADNL